MYTVNYRTRYNTIARTGKTFPSQLDAWDFAVCQVMEKRAVAAAVIAEDGEVVDIVRSPAPSTH